MKEIGHSRPTVALTHRFNHRGGARLTKTDPNIRSLAIELLCDAFPTGAAVLDARGRVIYANREGSELLLRWNRLQQNGRTGLAVPNEIIDACERLRHGRAYASAPRQRPRFGGRIFLRHPRNLALSAVVALERSRRNRHVAVFCVLLHDRFSNSLVAGRKDQLAMLTPAERRVAKLVAEGLRNSQIAVTLGKSITTVKSQLSAVFAKLQVESRTQLVTLLRTA